MLRKKNYPVGSIESHKGTLIHSFIKHKNLCIMFIPAIVYYIMFCYVPMYGILIAFKDYSFSQGIWNSPWIGLETFKRIFESASFWEVFRNTIVISVYKLITGFPAPIIFAILLNEIKGIKFKKTVQTISYLPHFLSWVILGGIFIQLLSPSTGAINKILNAMGFDSIYFLGDVKYFRSVLVVTNIWKSFGWGSIIYLAALSGINPEMYEAAMVDGAGKLQQIFKITLPSLVNVMTIMFIFSVGGLINDDFDQIFNLYNEAVYSVGDVISTYNYRMGLISNEYGYSTAVGLFKNLIAIGLILITNTLANKYNDYGLW